MRPSACTSSRKGDATTRSIHDGYDPLLAPLLPPTDERLQRVIGNTLEPTEIHGLIERLKQRGEIAVNETKVVYP